ncbi:MAG: hypothetical protein HY303_20730 [Candidatus Wallbacteria bacterium]|nr:hypothetical protein [Candidatus Wallbacteria bacterium]
MKVTTLDQRASQAPAARARLFGMFLVSGSLMLFELTLTRLLSVTLWYHFASFAISIALFGTAAAGVLGTLERLRRRLDALSQGLGWLAIYQALGMVLSADVFLRFDLRPHVTLFWCVKFLTALVLFAVPFLLGGWIILDLLRRREAPVGLLYGCDLAGAAAACVAFVPLLDRVSGPGAALLAAGLSLASVFFLEPRGVSVRARATLALLLVLAGLVANESGIWPWFHLRRGKTYDEENVLYEKWNAFCRITIFGEDFWYFALGRRAQGWGLSPTYEGPVPRQYWLEQDGSAGTPITEFHGDLKEVQHLLHDVTSAAYRYRQQKSALVIGGGGGRDILSALASGATTVTAVEINPDIVDAVEHRFRSFTGGPYSYPGVRAVVDEGRSYLSRSPDRYDVIQISLIDSFASSAAGGYVFSESALYTVEAMERYLDHLTPDGTLAIARWYLTDEPLEIMRLATLVREVLEKRGITDAAAHVAILRCQFVGTVLVKLSAFTAADLQALRKLCADERFSLATEASPRSFVSKLLSSPDWRQIVEDLPFDIGPTTDDRPFFFHPLKPTSFRRLFSMMGGMVPNMQAIWLLAGLVPVTGLLAMTALFAPLWLTKQLGKPPVAIGRSAATMRAIIAYFATLGAAYMLVEMSLLGRLVTVLGHPTYAISVVLAVMLLGSAAGSAVAQRVAACRAPGKTFGALLVSLSITLAAMTWIWPAVLGLPTWIRIGIVLLTVGPTAFFMGMPFSMGLERLGDDEGTLAWAWAANGALSVFAGTATTWIAVLWGFHTVLGAAVAAYALAGILYRRGIGA